MTYLPLWAFVSLRTDVQDEKGTAEIRPSFVEINVLSSFLSLQGIISCHLSEKCNQRSFSPFHE